VMGDHWTKEAGYFSAGLLVRCLVMMPICVGVVVSLGVVHKTPPSNRYFTWPDVPHRIPVMVFCISCLVRSFRVVLSVDHAISARLFVTLYSL
jgi:hypothetical protein